MDIKARMAEKPRKSGINCDFVKKPESPVNFAKIKIY